MEPGFGLDDHHGDFNDHYGNDDDDSGDVDDDSVDLRDDWSELDDRDRKQRSNSPYYPWLTAWYPTWLLKDEDEEREEAESQDSCLCRHCSRLSFDKIFRVNSTTDETLRKIQSLPWERLDKLSDWDLTNSSCPVCNLMAYTVNPDDSPPTLHLWIQWNDPPYENKYQPFSFITASRPSDDIFNTLTSPPFIVSSQARGQDFVRLLKTDSIDFDILSGWLRFCLDQHLCDAAVRSPSANVETLRVIDCEARRVVPVLNPRYLTLSYVWGPEKRKLEDFYEDLPTSLPNTIEDSIMVARKLGFRYLWIDQYCIDRRTNEVFIAQLHQMGNIYRNSALTIVAAAGDRDSYGLPGVGCQPRRPQPCAEVGGHLLVSSLSNPTTLISRSVWATRGWTYQESYLSARRLFFTDEQVYYECRCSFHSEVLNYDFGELRRRKAFRRWEGGMGVPVDPKAFDLKYDLMWQENLASVWKRIQDYTQRNFSDASDILKGFLGILASLENEKPPYKHFWGIPIPPPLPDFFYNRLSKHPLEYIDATKAGFVGGLSWELEQPSYRRHGFPSWSWTGWLGPIKVDYRPTSEPDAYSYRDSMVSVEFRNGQISSWEDYMKRYSQEKQQTETCYLIRLSAWATPLKILTQTKRKVIARMGLAGGRYMHWSFTPTTKDSLPVQNTYYAVWLWLGGEKWPYGQNPGPSILVVTDDGDGGGTAERVGCGVIWNRCCTFFEPNGDKRPCVVGPPMFAMPGQAVKKNWDKSVWLEGPAMFPKTWRTFRLG